LKTREELVQYFKDHDKVRVTDAHQAKVHSVAWNADGRFLASGSFDKTVSVFQLENGYKLTKDHTCRGHTDQVDQICWHKTNADLLASAGGDKTVRVWDVRSRKNVATIATKGENINIVWSPDGNTIAVGNKHDLISFIDARTYKILMTEQFKTETNELTWNTTGNLFFAVNGSGQIIIMSWPDLKVLLTLQAHTSNAICIDFDPTGSYFAVGSTDCLVSIWDAKWLACIRMMDRLDWSGRAVSFSHDGRLLACGSEDLVIDIGDVDSGRRVAELKCEAATFSLAWHPKSYLLAFSCDDKVMSSTYGRPDREAGTVKLYGLTSDQA